MLEHRGMSLSEQTLCWFMSWHTNHEYQQGLYLSAGSQGSYYGYSHPNHELNFWSVAVVCELVYGIPPRTPIPFQP